MELDGDAEIDSVTQERKRNIGKERGKEGRRSDERGIGGQDGVRERERKRVRS